MQYTYEACPFVMGTCEVCNLVPISVEYDSIWFIYSDIRYPFLYTAHVDVGSQLEMCMSV